MTTQVRQKGWDDISVPNGTGLPPRFKTAGYVVGISSVVLVPCLWQSHVESSDLSSHLYNAWLALLVSQGKLPGLWIERKWTNVLVDKLLSSSIRLFGAGTAEKIVPCLCALVFFWGAWHLVAALNKKPPLSITILLLAFTYGVIFQWGLFNYYLSLGLSFFALAAASKRDSRGLFIAGILLIIAFYAQPLPVLWAVGCAVYILVARRMRPRLRLAFLAVCIVGLIVIRYILVSRFAGVWYVAQIYHAFGPDQLEAWTSQYKILRDALWLYWVAMFVLLCRRYGVIRIALGIRVQLYVLTVVAAFIMPAALLYQDIRNINGIEEKVERLVSQILVGQRVISTLRYPPSYLIAVNPVPRACIGRCFVFSNNEIPSRQFRVRAEPGNSFSQWTRTEPPDAQFFAASPGLPLYEIYNCGSEVCLRKLTAPSQLK